MATQFQDVSSNDSINSAGEIIDVNDFYVELTELKGKIQDQYTSLKKREKQLKLREQKFKMELLNLNEFVEQEVKRRMLEERQIAENKQQELEEKLKSTTFDKNRVKENFETLKTANDTLRKELELLQSRHTKLEKQSHSLQARFNNLQKLRNCEERKEINEFLTQNIHKKPQSTNKNPSSASNDVSSTSDNVYPFECLSVLLEWISDGCLKYQSKSDKCQSFDQSHYSPENICEKCVKVIPQVSECLKKSTQSSNVKSRLPYLQFIYWSLYHVSNSPTYQKSLLSSTLRRLSSDLYSGCSNSKSHNPSQNSSHLPHSSAHLPENSGITKRPDLNCSSSQKIFFRSENIHERFLSSMIILRSINQADVLAQVFDSLRNQLKDETCRELYLLYCVTDVLIPMIKPTNKTVNNFVVDLLLQMCVDSGCQASFLTSCSTELFFRTVSMVLRVSQNEEKFIEKISILLQKLSKIRSNYRYFTLFGLVSFVQEKLHSVNAENAFIILNLKSTLANLSLYKIDSQSNKI